MANELTVNVGITFNPTGESFGGRDINVSMAGTRLTRVRQNIGTSEEALQLGELAGATLGYAWFRNLDSVNGVEIRTGTGATKMTRLKAGEEKCFRFGSGITAPYAIADAGATSGVLIDGVVFEA